MNSKKIGGAYERECAKKLSKWFTGDDKELVCWRNVHSGSIATIRNKKGLLGTNVAGDFQCLDSNYQPFFDRFFIDSKSLTKINLLMINKKNEKSNKLLLEWAKVVSDAENNFKIPMMMVKVRDDKSIPDFILLPYEKIIFDKVLDCMAAYMTFDFKHHLKYDCILLLQDEFFERINWKFLIL